MGARGLSNSWTAPDSAEGRTSEEQSRQSQSNAPQRAPAKADRAHPPCTASRAFRPSQPTLVLAFVDALGVRVLVRPQPRAFGPFPLTRRGVPVPVWDGAGERFVNVLVSPADYGLALSRRWRLDRNGYPCTTQWLVAEKRAIILYLHRAIARAPEGMQVDHRRHNPLDCRRGSLRHATPSQNSANTRRFLKGKLSRYRGVTLHKQTGKWQAAAKRGNRCIYLGLHTSEEAAARAYDAKARELWGEFAITNYLPSQKASVTGRAA